MLIGSSTKREQTGKIGMFGSGWKYALAYLIRNDATPIIFSGEKEIKIDFNVVLHRDNPVKVITVDGRETSLTTDMGPKWDAWMAIREIVSNAIDEGNYKLSTELNPQLNSNSDETAIFVPMTNKVADVIMYFNKYFSFNRIPDYTNKYGDIFIRETLEDMNVYRKGIRCNSLNTGSYSYYKTFVDFNLQSVSINEDRIAQIYTINDTISELLSEGIPTNVLRVILRSEYTSYLESSTLSSNMINSIKELIAEGASFTTTLIQKTGGLFTSKADALIIPQSWYYKLQELGLVASIFELFAGSNESFIPTNKKNVEGIKYHLKHFNVNIDVVSGTCTSNVFVNNSKAYVNDTSTWSDTEIAGAIMTKLTSEYYEQQLINA